MKRLFYSLALLIGVLGMGISRAESPAGVITAEPVLTIPKEVPTFQNLIRNGSFESALNGTSPDGWSVSQGVTLIDLDDTDRKAGHFSLLLKGPASLTQSVDALKELQGTKVVFGAWVKATQVGEVTLTLDDGKSVQSVANTLAGEWEFLTKKVSVSDQATKVDVVLSVSLAQDVLIDGVVLNQLTKSVMFTSNPSDDIKMPSSLIYTDLETGKVGIGKSDPSTTLDVAGDIRASGKVYQGELEQQEELLTSTIADEKYLNNDRDETLTKNLTVNGLLTSSTGKILNDLEVAGLVKAGRFEGDGSGLTNILSQWKSSTDGTGIYFDQGNVGIGKENPEAMLDVAGAINVGSASYAGGIKFARARDGYYQASIGYPGATDDTELRIGSTGGGSFISFYTGGGDKENMRIANSGNVGIGTSSPDQKLTVSGGNLRIDNGEEATIKSSGHSLSFGADGYAHRYYHFLPGAGVDSNTLARVSIYEGDTSLNYQEKIRLSSSDSSFFLGGNVGIGTTTPTANLEVVGTTYSTVWQTWGTNIFMIGEYGADKLHFTTDPGGTGGKILTLESTGNVGIGITAPNAKLDVSGDIRLTGNIVPDGDICIGRCN